MKDLLDVCVLQERKTERLPKLLGGEVARHKKFTLRERLTDTPNLSGFQQDYQAYATTLKHLRVHLLINNMEVMFEKLDKVAAELCIY